MVVTFPKNINPNSVKCRWEINVGARAYQQISKITLDSPYTSKEAIKSPTKIHG